MDKLETSNGFARSPLACQPLDEGKGFVLSLVHPVQVFVEDSALVGGERVELDCETLLTVLVQRDFWPESLPQYIDGRLVLRQVFGHRARI